MVVASVGPILAQSAERAQGQKPVLNMKISLNPAIAAVGSPVNIHIELLNTSSKEVAIFRRKAGPPLYTVEVLDTAKRAVPLTPYGLASSKGEMAFKDDKGNVRMMVSSGRMVPIPPGGTLEDEVILTELYDLTQPGTYTVRVERKDLDAGPKISSNMITLTIVK